MARSNATAAGERWKFFVSCFLSLHVDVSTCMFSFWLFPTAVSPVFLATPVRHDRGYRRLRGCLGGWPGERRREVIRWQRHTGGGGRRAGGKRADREGVRARGDERIIQMWLRMGRQDEQARQWRRAVISKSAATGGSRGCIA